MLKDMASEAWKELSTNFGIQKEIGMHFLQRLAERDKCVLSHV